MPMTKAIKKDDIALAGILCIYYLLYFQKNKKNKVCTLINVSNKVNIMTLVYASKLSLRLCCTNIKVQKIDDSTLKIFGIVLASF